MPPALLYSAYGLANDLEARWPKLLPGCTFGVNFMSFLIAGCVDGVPNGILNHVPPQFVVAGVVSSVGAVLFSDRDGQLFGVVCLWCILAAAHTPL